MKQYTRAEALATTEALRGSIYQMGLSDVDATVTEINCVLDALDAVTTLIYDLPTAEDQEDPCDYSWKTCPCQSCSDARADYADHIRQRMRDDLLTEQS